MEKIVKEVEIAGVKHSITLADNMVGSGLVKDENGCVLLKVLRSYPTTQTVMTGISFEGNALCLNPQVLASQLAGTGLIAADGRLMVSGKIGSGSVDVNTLCGSGLEVFNGKLQITAGLAGSGLHYIQGSTMDVQLGIHSGLCFDPSTNNKLICINIAKRDIGLRLFFNEKGELDVTEN